MKKRSKRKRGKQSAPLKGNRGPCCTHWFFTDNGEAGTKGRNLVGEAWKELPKGVTYLQWQLEAGGKTNHPHLQGHLELKRSQYLSWIHKHVSKTASFRVRRGTAEQCDAYCSKEEGRLAGPFTLGRKSKGQGSRTDLDAFREAIQRGDTVRNLLKDHTHMVAKYPRFLSTCKDVYRPKYDAEAKGPKVRLLYGKTGTGKSRVVFEHWCNKTGFYEMPLASGQLWWDGLDGHDLILYDDFSGASSHMRLDFLLKILDRYPRRVPVKGSHRWHMAKEVVITTNIHPRMWYDFTGREEQYLALKRRFTQVWIFKEDGPMLATEEFWQDPVLDPRPINAYKRNEGNFEWGPFKIHEKPKQTSMNDTKELFTL